MKDTPTSQENSEPLSQQEDSAMCLESIESRLGYPKSIRMFLRTEDNRSFEYSIHGGKIVQDLGANLTSIAVTSDNRY